MTRPMTNLSIPIFGPLAWIDVILLIWFALTVLSVIYVAWDAVTSNPSFAEGHLFLAKLYLDLNQLENAIGSARRGLRSPHAPRIAVGNA